MEMVFVYGTLRRGEANCRLLEGAEMVASIAYAKGCLVDTGFGFPAMIPTTDKSVTGELYEVNLENLIRLDRLEGYYGPGDSRNHYERTRIDVKTDYGLVMAWAYIYLQHAQDQVIPHGDWKLYRMRRQKNILYFAYGSCMDTKRIEEAGMADWFTQVEGRGVLDGFNLQFTRRATDGGRADVVESGGHTEGKLYRIPEQALEGYLYNREGVNCNIYRPIIIPIKCTDASIADALTFVVVNKEKETAPPVWYMEEIQRGALPVVSNNYYLTLMDRFISVFGYENVVNKEEIM
ncbi:gamma-glutamylcyclotransferase [Paenibacillus sp. LHD-38]|uniref:gamma-glutamylcyclotransferase n=1 Tax=Paenibacillus sp. LHD-38 TaxID=3072143 RepID=UPI0028104C8F|nr:gamma-glutamylcyclotransferase [Paenibacillus sp. LHD-38]MDQ8733983.1 gamma-glutamylcyclotransferase [Paenibacillus sp. LHD-38]